MRKRSILKALSWELISNTVCLGLAYGIFGNLGSCIVFTAAAIAIKIILFYYHDLVWSGIKLGKIMKYYKFLNSSLTHHGFKYEPDSINTDTIPFNPSGDCKPGGLYFAREDCLVFIDEFVCEVEPIGEVYLNPGEPVKWKAHGLKLGPLMKTVDVISKIIADGADVHAYDDYALIRASNDGHTEIVKLLIAAGADVRVDALRYASENGHTEIVKLLIAAGADVHADALRYAIENGHTEIVNLLEGKYESTDIS